MSQRNEARTPLGEEGQGQGQGGAGKGVWGWLDGLRVSWGGLGAAAGVPEPPEGCALHLEALTTGQGPTPGGGR